MQNKMNFYGYCNEIVYNHDFEIVLVEIFFDTLEYEVLDNNVCLYEIDYYKFLLFGVNNFTI